MEVRTEPFDERSEPDANGLHEYIYVGAHLHFHADGETLTFRIYGDDEQAGESARELGLPVLPADVLRALEMVT